VLGNKELNIVKTSLHHSPRRLNRPLAAFISSALATSAALADQTPPAAASGSLDEVVVTAQKRSENLQTVPISVQSIDSKHLEDLLVTSFDGYAKFLPSLSVQTYGPGQSNIYVRGVTNGSDGLKVGSQPLVGLYLDEMPVTTIANNLDIHIYDIERVEALSGPQGTLFGSSSMAGVLRIITNKPNTAEFSAGYDLTANTYTGGGPGGKVEGFVNIPISDKAAVRLVAFSERDGGYINNTANNTETYPTSGIRRDNTALAEKHYNTITTNGGRAALKYDLSDSWTISPTVMAQNQNASGSFGYTPSTGDLSASRYSGESNQDQWWQTGLTAQGKVWDLDLTYAGGYLHRTVDNKIDYSDYSYFYDRSYVNTSTPTYFGDNFRNNNGDLISPAQTEVSHDLFTKQSHELRLTSPKDWLIHGVVGVFMQRQTDRTRSAYLVNGLADAYSISHLPGVNFLDSQVRTDRDRAVFADIGYNLTSKLAITVGLRQFSYDNTVYGFFGYNGKPTYDGYTHASGEQTCYAGTQSSSAPWPCVNIDNRATKTGSTYRLNVTYQIDPDHMVYTTWSTGFRPGGVNRVNDRPPYQADYLTNNEVGWKTEWFAHRLRFNGALFFERWKDMQFGVTGLNGISETANAGASEIKGIESDLTWVVSEKLNISASVTALNAKVTTNACNFPSPSNGCTEQNIIYNADGSVAYQKDNSVLAPAGSRLPLSAKIKGNLIARYAFKVQDINAHVQAAMVAQTRALPQLQVDFEQIIGEQPGYASFDLSGGARVGKWDLELFVQNAFDSRGQATRYTSCAPTSCSLIYVIPIAPRLVGITVGQKF
jgi:outer membrane receptor protein involved in Fe transport